MYSRSVGTTLFSTVEIPAFRYPDSQGPRRVAVGTPSWPRDRTVRVGALRQCWRVMLAECADVSHRWWGGQSIERHRWDGVSAAECADVSHRWWGGQSTGRHIWDGEWLQSAPTYLIAGEEVSPPDATYETENGCREHRRISSLVRRSVHRTPHMKRRMAAECTVVSHRWWWCESTARHRWDEYSIGRRHWLCCCLLVQAPRPLIYRAQAVRCRCRRGGPSYPTPGGILNYPQHVSLMLLPSPVS